MEESLQLLPLPSMLTLMYHRIDARDTDPWGICVSPDHFEEQVKFLKNNFNVIHSADVIKQVTTGNVADSSICITFDDGYANNHINAKPILEKYNCPATFFIATAFINQTKPFWWDELEIILLHAKKLPRYLCLQIDKTYEYFFDESELTEKQWKQHRSWKWYEGSPTHRCKIFLDIWEKLRPLPYEEIEKQLAVIRTWACINDDAYKNRLPMNDEQLYKLSNNDLFTIGLHTHTHPDLQSTEKHIQAEEILSCKKLLKHKYGIESNWLAYPYGRYNNNTIEVVQSLQITGCFTTEAVTTYANADVNKLGRYQVCDGNISEFENQINTWFKNK